MPSQRLLLLLLSLSLTWVGCDDEPTPTPDAGTSDTDGGTDGSTPDDPTAVTLTRVLRYHTASGVETVADTSTVVPEVLIPEGASFRRIAGTSTGGANHRFTGVPAGTAYYLKRGTTYVVTDARTVDLSLDLLGRSDAGVASESGDMNVRLDVSGLEPVRSVLDIPAPGFEIVSGEVDFTGYVYADLEPGQSTFSGEVQAGNVAAPGVPLFLAERGDRAWVNQFANRDAGTLSDGGVLTATTLVRSLQVPAFSYDGGTPAELRGALQPVPMTDLSLDWRLSAFAAYAPVAHPGATSSTSTFTVLPAAHGLEYGWVGYSGELLTLSTRRGTTEDIVSRMSYGNPFPSNWGVLATATHTFRYPTTLPGGAQTTLTATMSNADRMPTLVAGPIVPRLSPPRGLTLNGQDAYVPRRLEGSSHVVAWTAPELGTPSIYNLTLYRYDPPATGTNFATPILAARFYVAGSIRSVQLPPEVLQAGKDYSLRLTAYSAPGVDLASAPLVIANRVPLYGATTVSAIFTTP